MAGSVRPGLLNGSALVNRAVAVYDKVIADVAPAVSLDVPLADLLNGEILALWRSRAMDNDFVNCPHVVGYYVIDWNCQSGGARTGSDTSCRIPPLRKSESRQRR